MRIVKAAVSVAVTLAIVFLVTAILWLVRQQAAGPQHLVFFYLMPTALVAVLYGSRPAMLGAVAATICAAYFLYAPLYSFSVANPVELGEIFCFAALALIGAKCTADVLRPTTRVSSANERDPVSG